MKKLFFIYILVLSACSKNSKEEEQMSDCIAAKVEKFKTEPRFKNISSISEYTLNRKLYYRFDYGGVADAPVYILDNQCDTICKITYLYGAKCKIDNFAKAKKVKVIFE